MDEEQRARRWFLAVWAIVTMVKVAIAARLPLFVDEAFYWQEGQHLAAAYSDLPGLTAWLTRLGSARVALDADPRLRLGLFASGWIVTDRREALTVPLSAILSDDAGTRVQVVKDGVIETRPVKPGLIWQDRREILDGLAAGERVVARAGAFFQSGDRVRAAP